MNSIPIISLAGLRSHDPAKQQQVAAELGRACRDWMADMLAYFDACKERFSVAFFLEVDPDSVVDSRDLFTHLPAKYEPVTCSNYLAGRLNATYRYHNTAP